MPTNLEELWQVVRSIPRGRVASYGAVGRELGNPWSGFLVGRRMGHCPQDLPWWRVVGKNGELRTAARDPRLAKLQIDHLGSEGVQIVDGRVDMAAYAMDW